MYVSIRTFRAIRSSLTGRTDGSEPSGCRSNRHSVTTQGVIMKNLLWWLSPIERLIHEMRKTREIIMTALEALAQAQTDVATKVDQAVVIIATIPDIKKQVADLQAALAAVTNVDPQVQATADALQVSVAKLDSAVKSVA